MSENSESVVRFKNRAVIYTRFSTDLQNERSVEDQVTLCRSYALRENIEVVRVYEDRARSGASILGREGLLELLEDARARKFSVVIAEALAYLVTWRILPASTSV
jgi:site-specific DNA recombinase